MNLSNITRCSIYTLALLLTSSCKDNESIQKAQKFEEENKKLKSVIELNDKNSIATAEVNKKMLLRLEELEKQSISAAKSADEQNKLLTARIDEERKQRQALEKTNDEERKQRQALEKTNDEERKQRQALEKTIDELRQKSLQSKKDDDERKVARKKMLMGQIEITLDRFGSINPDWFIKSAEYLSNLENEYVQMIAEAREQESKTRAIALELISLDEAKFKKLDLLVPDFFEAFKKYINISRDNAAFKVNLYKQFRMSLSSEQKRKDFDQEFAQRNRISKLVVEIKELFPIDVEKNNAIAEKLLKEIEASKARGKQLDAEKIELQKRMKELLKQF